MAEAKTRRNTKRTTPLPGWASKNKVIHSAETATIRPAAASTRPARRCRSRCRRRNDDLDAAERHLETSAELGESAGLPQHAYRWRVTMARLRRAQGDLDALALLDEARPLFDTDFSPPVRPVAAIQARVQLAHGDLEAAEHDAATAAPSRSSDPRASLGVELGSLLLDVFPAGVVRHRLLLQG